MKDRPESAPIIHFNREPTPEEQSAISAQLRNALHPPPPPLSALHLLFESACRDTGGSQAARSFLFWLAGNRDPTGYRSSGGLELRRLDSAHKTAALEILAWWAGPTQSDTRLFEILERLSDRFDAAPGGASAPERRF